MLKEEDVVDDDGYTIDFYGDLYGSQQDKIDALLFSRSFVTIKCKDGDCQVNKAIFKGTVLESLIKDGDNMMKDVPLNLFKLIAYFLVSNEKCTELSRLTFENIKTLYGLAGYYTLTNYKYYIRTHIINNFCRKVKFHGIHSNQKKIDFTKIEMEYADEICTAVCKEHNELNKFIFDGLVDACLVVFKICLNNKYNDPKICINNTIIGLTGVEKFYCTHCDNHCHSKDFTNDSYKPFCYREPFGQFNKCCRARKDINELLDKNKLSNYKHLFQLAYDKLPSILKKEIEKRISNGHYTRDA
jgi:hypothetical protein